MFLFNYMCVEPAGQSVLPKGGMGVGAVSGSVGNSSGLAPLQSRFHVYLPESIQGPSSQTVNAVDMVSKSHPN